MKNRTPEKAWLTAAAEVELLQRTRRRARIERRSVSEVIRHAVSLYLSQTETTNDTPELTRQTAG